MSTIEVEKRMERSAAISECGRFRHNLFRRWGDGKILVFIMLNPSTADGNEDDPTIRRCIGFAKNNGCDGIAVVNLYDFRATDPKALKAACYPQSDVNTENIMSVVTRDDVFAVCVAWGANARGLSRADEVLRLLRKAGIQPMALGVDSHGGPRHPLYLPASASLKVYEITHPAKHQSGF